MFDIHGKKAIITGAAGEGLGSGMAKALLSAGAALVIIDISAALEESVKKLSAFGEVWGVRADISSAEGRKAAFGEALALLGGVDIFVNCAGIQRRSPSEDFSMEDWNAVLEVNLTATFDFCQLAGREMLKQGSGKIINVASMLSFFGGYTVPAYAASKGGVAQLTKALSNEWACRGVNVNAIAPGYMATQMNTKLIEDAERNKKILARIPQGRWGTPEDVGGVTVFLASAASDYINGAVIPVDGGYLGC